MKMFLKYFFPCLLIHFLLACVSLATQHNITTDQDALLSLKPLITSEIFSRNWSAAFPVCHWAGVTCGAGRKRITALNISNTGSTGVIPPKLGNLTFLVFLDLSENNFHGELPPELARLRRLRYLNLGLNDLSGEIPSWFFSSFSKLQQLILENNSFSGSIPPSISNISTLERLRLSFNNLEGTVPKEIGNLQNLKELTCEANQLSGSLPAEIFNMSSLEVIELPKNRLSGSLPNDTCPGLHKLFRLNLSENKFNGGIPSTLSQCSALQVLSLSFNNFSRVIPKEIGNLTELVTLYLNDNNLEGMIPQELGNLYNMETLQIKNNNLTGSIAASMFNLSRLITLDVSGNGLSGNLPQNTKLPFLRYLFLQLNHFGGVIPNSISNCSQLIKINLSENEFTGSIPCSLGDLRFLETFIIYCNNLNGGPSSTELSFITCLTNCKVLKKIEASFNPLFNGYLPKSISNFSSSLERFGMSSCNIKGRIPNGIGNITGLINLILENNQLIGPIPDGISNLQKLQGLNLKRNNLSKFMPNKLCSLSSLAYLTLSQNQFSGLIPKCLGNITSLRGLHLDSNRFYSNIPANLFNLKNILELNLSSNSLNGTMEPGFGNLKAASYIDLSKNSLSGALPTSLGDLQNLQNLALAHNTFQGSIPDSVGNMLSMVQLDLSHNHLSGLIPRTLVKLQYLTGFNVSFNNLSGEIPFDGPFKNFTGMSFISNDGLCGGSSFHVPPCPTISTKRFGIKQVRIFISVGVAAISVVVVLGLFVYLRYRKRDEILHAIELPSRVVQERISYYELRRATDEFSESNLLGTGSFGSVYRGTLVDGRVVAIKVFHLQIVGAFKSFDVECEILRNLRHRNLTKVISSCSNDHDFKALILEFMPNGSLDKWLYSHNNFLDINKRVSIMIDVATALQYLHDGYSMPVVHCDLKPSNILLDQDMVAHVSDFGISKLLDHENSGTYTKTLATFGYLAPEYGLEGLVSRKCDIYSYGILLMEVFTRRKPNDEMFGETMSLRSWVNDSVTESLQEVIDPNLLNATNEEQSTRKLGYVSSILKIALICSEESPSRRCSIQDVLVALEKIWLQILKNP